MRIWYQSYVDYANGKTYWDRLRAHLNAIVDAGTTVDIKGITPHDSYAHALVEMRCAREVVLRFRSVVVSWSAETVTGAGVAGPPVRVGAGVVAGVALPEVVLVAAAAIAPYWR